MKVIPAIDLLGGRAVRLSQGDRARATIYPVSPAQVLDGFIGAGVTLVHLVDLDGAFGEAPQRELLTDLIARAHRSGVAVELGGGLRDAATIERVLADGADFAVVGTLALREPDITRALCRAHPGRIVIAADAREGKVAVDGWREDSGRLAVELARDAERWGAAALLYTDIARDGLQGGPAIEATCALQAAVTIPVYASGGVGALEHLDACRLAGVRGVVLGRALYEQRFSIEEAMARC